MIGLGTKKDTHPTPSDYTVQTRAKAQSAEFGQLKPDVSLGKLGQSDDASLPPEPPHQSHFDESLTKTNGNMQYRARLLGTAAIIPSYVCLQYMPSRAESLLSCSIEK